MIITLTFHTKIAYSAAEAESVEFLLDKYPQEIEVTNAELLGGLGNGRYKLATRNGQLCYVHDKKEWIQIVHMPLKTFQKQRGDECIKHNQEPYWWVLQVGDDSYAGIYAAPVFSFPIPPPPGTGWMEMIFGEMLSCEIRIRSVKGSKLNESHSKVRKSVYAAPAEFPPKPDTMSRMALRRAKIQKRKWKRLHANSKYPPSDLPEHVLDRQIENW